MTVDGLGPARPATPSVPDRVTGRWINHGTLRQIHDSWWIKLSIDDVERFPTVDELRAAWKATGPRMRDVFENLTEEEMISGGLSAPLHPGAEKYYKERGWM